MSGIAFRGELTAGFCPSCPHAESHRVFLGQDGIGFYRCLSCSLWFASPRFTEASLLEIYESPDYLSRSFRTDWSYDDWRKSSSRAYLHARLKVRFFRQFLPAGSRLLDVGCGPGLTVAEALAQGFSCEGIDPSSRLVALGKERFGVPLQQATAESFKPESLYDGVVVWDVLEHVHDPVRLLRSCRNFLRPQGLLFVQVPHHGGLSNRTKAGLARIGLRRHFRQFGFPWHIYAFDRTSLNRLLASAGFRSLRLESWTSSLKNDRNNHLYRPFNALFRRLCWGDYLACAAIRGDRREEAELFLPDRRIQGHRRRHSDD